MEKDKLLLDPDMRKWRSVILVIEKEWINGNRIGVTTLTKVRQRNKILPRSIHLKPLQKMEKPIRIKQTVRLDGYELEIWNSYQTLQSFVLKMAEWLDMDID